jgi:phytoene dehydrogenase-like protein
MAAASIEGHPSVSDAVVIGAGPNGLVAANLLVDHGWSVTVLEAEATAGGGVRSEALIEPAYTNDICSAFYPLAAVSAPLADLELDQWGLRWLHAPDVIGHPALDGTCPIISRDVDRTASSLDQLTPGDGDAWRELFALWLRLRPSITDALLHPFPPVRAGLAAAVRARHDIGDVLRLLALPVRRLAEERFEGPAPARLLAGLHADLMPEAVLSGLFGWLLASLGQEVGFPVPQGGAQSLTDALVKRLESKGGRLECGRTVDRIEVRTGRATAVQATDGTVVPATRAVIADVDAVQLYLHLIDAEHLPSSTLRHMRAFQWDHSTFKVDWNLDGPIPWSADAARSCGTVHVAENIDALTMAAAAITTGAVPKRPVLVMGQQALTDSSRQPAGKDTAFAYTHLPRAIRSDEANEGITGDWTAGDADRLADRIEREVEALAPGFRSLIRGRHVLSPDAFTQRERSMPLGALNLGTAQLHQQLVLRPIPGLGRSETPIKGLYLGSASAHPGGGVHGACGANAARAALMHHRLSVRGRRR